MRSTGKIHLCVGLWPVVHERTARSAERLNWSKDHLIGQRECEDMMSDTEDDKPPNPGSSGDPDVSAVLNDHADAVLDEIDAILEEGSEPFVRSFVGRGGQGWSAFLDPAFYTTAAAHGVISGASWAAVKAAMTRVLRSLRQVRPINELTPEGNLDPHLEQQLRDSWDRTRELLTGAGIDHSADEATALHWTLFAIELKRELKTIELPAEYHDRIYRAAAETPEQLTPSQLVTRIVDQWLQGR